MIVVCVYVFVSGTQTRDLSSMALAMCQFYYVICCFASSVVSICMYMVVCKSVCCSAYFGHLMDSTLYITLPYTVCKYYVGFAYVW